MKLRAFKQVDVFTDTPYLGNPLAVVLDGADLSSADMQHFASWTKLSETAFLLPPSAQAAAQGADYRVRIFTPLAELPFAGHPSLGSCHAWLQAAGEPKSAAHIVQECALGLVHIRRDANRLAFAAPALKRSTPEPSLLSEVCRALGLAAEHVVASQMLDNGPLWLGLLVAGQQTLLQLAPDHQALKNLQVKVGLVSVEQAQQASQLIARSNREARAFGVRAAPFNDPAAAPDVQVRAFAAAVGVDEDPVTGSLNASLAQWLIADGLAPTDYIATQGTSLGRHGQVHIRQDNAAQVWVGGASVTCIDGTVYL